MRPIRAPLLALSLSVVCLTACGEEPRRTVDIAQVQGAPLDAAPAASPEPLPLGDLDPGKGDPAPVVAPAVPPATAGEGSPSPQGAPPVPAPDEAVPPPAEPNAPAVEPEASGTADDQPAAQEVPTAPESAEPPPAEVVPTPDAPPVEPPPPAAADGAPAPAEGPEDDPGLPAVADPVEKDGVLHLGFEFLACFEYLYPDLYAEDEGTTKPEIPAKVLALNGKVIAVKGHMIPVKYDHETLKVYQFILSRYLAGCCFGDVPMLNEMVEVSVEDKGGVPYESYRVVEVTGRIEVGEQDPDSPTYFGGIYRMVATKVEVSDP